VVFSSQTGEVRGLGHLNRPRDGPWVEDQIVNKALVGTKMGNGTYAAGTPRFTKKVKAIVEKKQEATAEEMKFATEFVNGLPSEDDNTDESDDADDGVARAPRGQNDETGDELDDAMNGVARAPRGQNDESGDESDEVQ